MKKQDKPQRGEIMVEKADRPEFGGARTEIKMGMLVNGFANGHSLWWLKKSEGL